MQDSERVYNQCVEVWMMQSQGVQFSSSKLNLPEQKKTRAPQHNLKDPLHCISKIIQISLKSLSESMAKDGSMNYEVFGTK